VSASPPEVNSPSDDVAETVAKLPLHMQRGRTIVVAIDPQTRGVSQMVALPRASGSTSTRSSTHSLAP